MPSDLFATMAPASPKFLIVDGHALIYRAFHAFPPMTDPESQIVGALYGFLRTLLTVLKQLEPAYWLVAVDDPAPTKRKLEYEFYKANRKEMPEELKPQIPLIEEAVAKLGIPAFKCPGIEADDFIGTVSRIICASKRAQVRILTGDRDSFQLVNDCIHVLVPNVGRRRGANVEQGALLEYNEAKVQQKMGVWPKQIIDFKALAGDASDNIPGVPGIGAKTALMLIQRFGDLDQIYRALDLETVDELRSSVVAKLIVGRESAFISRKLATIDQNVELDFDFDKCQVSGYNKQEMMLLLQRYGFTSLFKLLPQDDFDVGLQAALF
jgi:DNA polymerase-1